MLRGGRRRHGNRTRRRPVEEERGETTERLAAERIAFL
jgi:hypothetical protein